MKHLVLASQSPRRRFLLEQANFSFRTIPIEISEFLEKNLNPKEQIKDLARRKAQTLVTSQPDLKGSNILVLSADTVVVLDTVVLGKPESKIQAVEYLNRLSDRTHLVWTAVCLWDLDSGRWVTDLQETKVTFRNLSSTEIQAYVDTGKPMDKAGAYGVQDEGQTFVSQLDGPFDNVMGLPVLLVEQLLKDNNWNVARTKPENSLSKN